MNLFSFKEISLILESQCYSPIYMYVHTQVYIYMYIYIYIYILDGLLGFAQIPKRKLIKNLKKYVTRLGFEPATSCVAFGYSNHLAIDQKEKLIKSLKKN